MRYLPKQEMKRSLRYAYLEGILGAPIATITSGALLTGFSLYLGATPFEISIILALPFLTQIVQLLGPQIIDNAGDSKKVTANATLIARLLWIFIAPLPVTLIYEWNPVPLFIVISTVSLLFFNIGLNSWLLWMSGLVPGKIRGRFFGWRNMYVGVVSTIVLLGAGAFLDWFTTMDIEGWGYAILILSGVLLGVFSYRAIKQISAVPSNGKESVTYSELLQETRTNSRFRSIVRFITLWTLATSVAAPFWFVHLFEFFNWSYTEVTLYAALSTGLPFIIQPFWGGILDRVGHKPLLRICITGVTLVPLFWIVMTPETAHLLWVEAVISGTFWAGINITVFNIVLYALPAGRKAPLVALSSTITGVINFCGMILGGFVVSILSGISFQIGSWYFIVFHAAFFLSFVGRIIALGFIKKIQEPEAKETIVVAHMIVSGFTKRISLGRQFWVFWTHINGKNGKNHRRTEEKNSD